MMVAKRNDCDDKGRKKAMRFRIRLGRREPELCGTTIRRECRCAVVVVDMVSSGRVGIVRSKLHQTELVVGACGIARVHHEKLCISIGGSVTRHPVGTTSCVVCAPEELVVSSWCLIIVICVMRDGVKLAGVGNDESLASSVGIVVIRHVRSGIRKSVLTARVNGIPERHVSDHTGWSARCHRDDCCRRCRLRESGGGRCCDSA